MMIVCNTSIDSDVDDDDVMIMIMIMIVMLMMMIDNDDYGDGSFHLYITYREVAL